MAADDAVLRRRVAGCRVLRAQDNQLREFPPEFETLTALEELRLGGNRLRSLPISLEALQNVRVFFQSLVLLQVCRTIASSISWEKHVPCRSTFVVPRATCGGMRGSNFWGGNDSLEETAERGLSAKQPSQAWTQDIPACLGFVRKTPHACFVPDSWGQLTAVPALTDPCGHLLPPCTRAHLCFTTCILTCVFFT